MCVCMGFVISCVCKRMGFVKHVYVWHFCIVSILRLPFRIMINIITFVSKGEVYNS